MITAANTIFKSLLTNYARSLLLRTKQMNSDRVDLESISTLVPLAKKGDHDAQAQIFEQIYDVVLRMARKNFGPELQQRQNPSDVVQLTMARMINGFEGFQGESEEEFFGWLSAILKNEIHVLRRNQNLQKRDVKKEIRGTAGEKGIAMQGVDRHPTPGTAAIANEKVQLLQSALARLPEDSAQVIRLRNIEELSFHEIAERMGRSYNAVAKLWQRAIVQLEHELDDDER